MDFSTKTFQSQIISRTFRWGTGGSDEEMWLLFVKKIKKIKDDNWFTLGRDQKISP